MTQEPILKARGLVKRYGRVTALDHCDFDLMPGEILAVIGDNALHVVDDIVMRGGRPPLLGWVEIKDVEALGQ